MESKGISIGIFSILTIIFVLLKAFGVINFTWFQCFIPLIVGAVLTVLILLVTLILIFKRQKERFITMLFKFYIGISIFAFIFNLLISIYVARKFKRENPEIIPPKMPLFEKCMSYFRSILVSFIPIIHILFIIIWLLAWDTCVEATEDRLWDELEKWDSI